MLTGRGAGGHQESCRNRRVAYIEIELEAVNGMDRAGPFAFLNAASRERLPLEGPRMNPWSFYAPAIHAVGEVSHLNLELGTLYFEPDLWPLVFGLWTLKLMSY